MTQKLNKLELTWIEKDTAKIIEPRILLENPNYSFGDVNSENIIINGDNLLALRALEQQFSGTIKCVCVDPPFNTGAAFEHYDDGIQHSTWLDLMCRRFKIIYNLLADDGFLLVHLDDSEMAYCKVMLDEIFGRDNYLNTISMTTNEPSGFKATGSSIFSTANFILLYAKNRYKSKINKIYIEKDYDKAYSKVLLNDRNKDHFSTWKYTSISDVVSNSLGFTNQAAAKKSMGKEVFENAIKDYAIKNAKNVFRTAAIGGGAKLKRQKTIDLSKQKRDEVITHPNEDVDGFFILNGEQIIFYDNRLYVIDGKLVPGQVITDVWTDISWTGIANEGGVEFKNGKKPEKLIARLLELTTKKNDWVLDSFLGSGTTAAVSHKMQRRYIGIELGEQATSHCLPRLKSIVQGKDQTGISKTLNWQGGGGFKFYTLAPSLVQKDKYGTEIINPEYNPNMLAAAMAKQEGFRYQPDENNYWKQGMSSEKDFIFTTTQFVTIAMLDKLAEELNPNESLLVCCKSFAKGCNARHANITIKKIPQMLLGRCEFGKDDYSFNIVNLPHDETELEYEPEETNEATPTKTDKKTKTKKQADDESQSTLF
jgi:adenine-specific DNA-methyltransferase